MHQHFTASFIRKTFNLFTIVTLLAGIALSAIPLLVARAASIIVADGIVDFDNNDGQCSLIEAIMNANGDDQSGSTECTTGTGADVIELVEDAIYTVSAVNNTTPALGPNGLPSITSEITINGHGATIERDSVDVFRIFDVDSGGDLTLTNITIANGNAAGSYYGGGILNSGTLNISNSTLSGNTAGEGGGGIHSVGTLTLNNSTVHSNTASGGGGIGIHGEANTTTINNSTLNGNTADEGGGIVIDTGAARVTINNSTISGNSADGGGGIITSAELMLNNCTVSGNTATLNGAGLYNDETATVYVKNTIIAGNTGEDCYTVVGGALTSQGYNMDSDGSCITNGVYNDITTATPGLDPLQDNGGPTWTHALLPGSPAIDHIPYETNGCGTTYTTDQRGYDRPYPAEGSCDIGAYEDDTPRETPTPTNTPTDTPTPTVTPTSTSTPTPTPTSTPIFVACDVTDLISDINVANIDWGPDSVNLAIDCTYTLDTADNTTDGPNGLPSITSHITMYGNGATIERSSEGGIPEFRIFHVASGANLTLTNITIANGKDSGIYAGGIYNKGMLNISHSALSGNTGNCGGAICNGGTLNVNNSTLSGNTASYGGGICGGGALNISHSTISSNTATGGDGSGGGIYSLGTGDVKNTILAGNTPDNCDDTMTSQGYNLESGTDCGFTQPSDLRGAAANLGPLTDNGGPTWTHALLPGSSAINHIPYETNGCGTTYTTDQRGYNRPCPAEGGCDIGAYEASALFGDLDCDCVVDKADVMLVASRWHCQSGDDCYDARYDLDEDGDIDVVDIMLVTAHWGDAC